MPIVPEVPKEYKLFKIVDYFNLDKNKDYNIDYINTAYDLFKAFSCVDSWEDLRYGKL